MVHISMGVCKITKGLLRLNLITINPNTTLLNLIK